jgi:hypothetical protein
MAQTTIFNIPTPFNHREGGHTFGLLYAAGKNLETSTYGTRFNLGPNQIAQRVVFRQPRPRASWNCL